MCSHDPFFRTNKESSIWRQNDHAEFVGTFHLSRRLSDENRACSISIRFFKITDPFDVRPFLMCSHDLFFGTNKNRIFKNRSCEQAFKMFKMLELEGAWVSSYTCLSILLATFNDRARGTCRPSTLIIR